jgi:hypothetical protein
MDIQFAINQLEQFNDQKQSRENETQILKQTFSYIIDDIKKMYS